MNPNILYGGDPEEANRTTIGQAIGDIILMDLSKGGDKTSFVSLLFRLSAS